MEVYSFPAPPDVWQADHCDGETSDNENNNEVSGWIYALTQDVALSIVKQRDCAEQTVMLYRQAKTLSLYVRVKTYH